MNDVMKEAYWCIGNLIEKIGTEKRIELIKKHKLIKLVTHMLQESTSQVKVIKILLICINKLLKTSIYFVDNCPDEPRYAFQCEGGVDIIEDLQKTPNTEIFSLTQKLLKEHYPNSEEGN